MRRLTHVVLALTIIASLFALWLSIWPGVLIVLLFMLVFSSVLWVPAALMVAGFISIRLSRNHHRGTLTPLPIKAALAIPLILFVTLVLLIFYVPRRVAFLASRSAFEKVVEQASHAKPGHDVPIDGRLGIYHVDACRVDSRGGVFFRVIDHGDGPDVISYGFVKQPNREGTPFGAAKYAIFRLGGDWYWFRASDDW